MVSPCATCHGTQISPTRPYRLGHSRNPRTPGHAGLRLGRALRRVDESLERTGEAQPWQVTDRLHVSTHRWRSLDSEVAICDIKRGPRPRRRRAAYGSLTSRRTWCAGFSTMRRRPGRKYGRTTLTHWSNANPGRRRRDGKSSPQQTAGLTPGVWNATGLGLVVRRWPLHRPSPPSMFEPALRTACSNEVA